MVEENKSKEKGCLFFASDYHFEMITIPYISKEIKDNKNVIVVTENNLEDTVKKLLNNLNLDDKEKDNILEINWNNNDFNKFKAIKEFDSENKKTTIFIKGKENYIENVNKNIENWISEGNTKIIDCYDLNGIEGNVNEIANKYGSVLFTGGEKNTY